MQRFALPSQTEQLALQNTDALQRSNLLQLQTDELLNEVCNQKEVEKKKVQAWLRQVTAVLQKPSAHFNNSGEVIINKAWVRSNLRPVEGLEGLGGPDDSTTLTFLAPTAVEIVGSHGLKTGTAPMFNIDIAVEMPSACFDSRDILNHAYFSKRRLYLYALWYSLEQACEVAAVTTISAAPFKGDVQKPILVLRPSSFRSHISIRIILVAPSNVFKLSRLNSNKNNVRPESWLKAVKSSSLAPDSAVLKPTPRYNLAILEDLAILQQHKILSELLVTCPIARNTIILFKVWLTQRSMRFAYEGIDSHYAALLVGYLVQANRIVNQMTSLAAFQVLLRFLADTELANRIYNFLTTTPEEKTDMDIASGTPFIVNFPLIYHTENDIDKEGKINKHFFHFSCLWRVSSSSLSDLSAEARQSLQSSSAESSAFSKLFMNKSSFFDRHDIFFHIPYHDSTFSAQSPRATRADGAHVDVYSDRLQEAKEAISRDVVGRFLVDQITSVLQEALGNRVLALRVIQLESSSTNNVHAHASSTECGVFYPQWREKTLMRDNAWSITVGMILDKDASFRKVDRGPAADDEEASAAFREFWGPLKSKLRRFQDGSIVEAVLWDEQSKAVSKSAAHVPRGERIVEEIVRYILARHVPLPCALGSMQCRASRLEQLFLPAPGHLALDETSSVPAASRTQHDAETLARKANESFDSLRSILISKMKNLPLMIESVSATCAELRYTALIPPQPHPLLLDKEAGLKNFSGSSISLVTTPLHVTARVEAGGRWPSDREAIINVKSALLLRIGDLLSAQFQIQSMPHVHFIDIFCEGFVFRLDLLASVEIERLQHPHTCLFDRQSIDFLHHNAVKALHSQHPSYGNAVRLLSRWLAGNYFSGVLLQESLELLVASVYVEPEYGVAPSSPLAGFRRALLKIANHDWENLPLIVDFSGDISLAERLKISTRFQSSRNKKTSTSTCAMYVVSSVSREDDFNPVYSEVMPSRVELRMVAAAAVRSYELLISWCRASAIEDAEFTHIVDCPAPPAANATLRFSKSIVAVSVSSTTTNKKGPGAGQPENGLWEGLRSGPPFARLKVYSNLSARETAWSNLVIRSSQTPHPIQEEVVGDLRKTFGDVALFLWNGITGRDVRVILKPSAFLPERFKVLQSANRLALESSNEFLSLLSVTEILSKILATGNGVFDLSHTRLS